MTWDPDDYQGKREDQVTTSEFIAGFCVALILVVLIAAWIAR